MKKYRITVDIVVAEKIMRITQAAIRERALFATEDYIKNIGLHAFIYKSKIKKKLM